MSCNSTSWASNGNLCKSKTQTTSRLIYFSLSAPILCFGAFKQLHEKDIIMYTIDNILIAKTRSDCRGAWSWWALIIARTGQHTQERRPTMLDTGDAANAHRLRQTAGDYGYEFPGGYPQVRLDNPSVVAGQRGSR